MGMVSCIFVSFFLAMDHFEHYRFLSLLYLVCTLYIYYVDGIINIMATPQSMKKEQMQYILPTTMHATINKKYGKAFVL